MHRSHPCIHPVSRMGPDSFRVHQHVQLPFSLGYHRHLLLCRQDHSDPKCSYILCLTSHTHEPNQEFQSETITTNLYTKQRKIEKQSIRLTIQFFVMYLTCTQKKDHLHLVAENLYWHLRCLHPRAYDFIIRNL